MRSIVVSVAALLFAAAGPAPAQTAPPVPDIQHVMVIITVAPTSTNGVQMAYLTFPSERACKAAAGIFGQPVDGVTVVARCAPAK